MELEEFLPFNFLMAFQAVYKKFWNLSWNKTVSNSFV